MLPAAVAVLKASTEADGLLKIATSPVALATYDVTLSHRSLQP